MTMAVVQERLEPVSVDALIRAFSKVKCLTAADAPLMARDANGILVEGLSPVDAGIVAGSLCDEGIAVCVRPSTEFASLPLAISSRKAEIIDGGLVILDPLGRRLVCAAEYIKFLAAGVVVEYEQVRETVRQPVTALTPRSRIGHYGGGPVPRTVTRTRQESRHRFVCELFCSVGPQRLRLGDDTWTAAAGVASELKSEENTFRTWIQNVISLAPNAVLNRGAFSCTKPTLPVYEYPSRHAFEEELRWWIWKKTKAGE